MLTPKEKLEKLLKSQQDAIEKQRLANELEKQKQQQASPIQTGQSSP